MKQFFLSITLFSILATLPVNILGQQPQADSEGLFKQLQKEYFDAKDYAKAIETATKLIGFSTTNEKAKVFVHEIRADSLRKVYFSNGGKPGSDYTSKYSANTVEKLRLAISDYVKAIDFYKQLPSKEIADEETIRDSSSLVAMIYLNLGKYSSHNPADFAKAEEFFKLASTKKAAPKSNPNDLNNKIVQSIAGQYKFNEARELAKRVLAAETENDFDVTLSKIVEAFDSMGEYQFADAFLLEQAGIRKVANKSLTPIRVIKTGRENAQKKSIGFENPTTVTELNRKGALLALTQQCDKAMPLFDKSMGIAENPTAARFAIQCLMGQKDYESVWQTSNDLINLDKNDVVALSFRAILLSMQEGEAKATAQKAEADLSKAISVFPELASFYNGLDNAKKIYQFQNKPTKVNEIEALEKKLAELNGEIAKADQSDGIGDILDEDDEEANAEFETLLLELIKDSMKTSSMSFSSYAKGKPVSDADGTKYFNLKDQTPFFDFVETIYLFYGYTAGKKRSVMIKFNLLYDEDEILQSIKDISDELKNGGNDSKIVKKTVDNKTVYDLDISNSTRLRFMPESNTLMIFGL